MPLPASQRTLRPRARSSSRDNTSPCTRDCEIQTWLPNDGSTRRGVSSDVAGGWHPVDTTTGEVNVEILSLSDINARHRELVDEVGLSIDELEILRELERLEFLTGH